MTSGKQKSETVKQIEKLLSYISFHTFVVSFITLLRSSDIIYWQRPHFQKEKRETTTFIWRQ